MAAGRTYFKKGTQPPQHAGYTGVFAGEDGILRSIQDDGTVTLLQASGSIPGSGLSYEGFYLNVGAGTGILVDATNVALDTGYLDTNYAASGNYIIKSVADATYQPVGNYEASGTADAKVAVHNAIWDHNSFVINTLSVLAGAGLSGGGDLSTDRTLTVGEGWGIIVQANSVAVASGTLDSRYALSGVPVVNTLNDLSDVSVAAPASGTRLTFDGSNWVATPVAAGENLTKGEADALYQPLGSYEASGAADTERAAHEAAADPHPLYLLEADAATTYETSGAADTERAAHEALYDHTAFVGNTRNLTAGAGLTGGGDLSGDRTFDVGAGAGISVAADAVAVDFTAVAASGNYVTFEAGDIRYALSGAGGGVGAHTIISAEHTDTAGTPTSGQFLGYDGTVWRPADVNQAQPVTVLSGNHIFTAFSGTNTYKLQHDFNGYPLVQVFDSSYCLVDVDLCYSGLNHVELTFLGEVSGYIAASLGGYENIQAGSGLYTGSPIFHVGEGWGVTVSDSGISVNQTHLDARYALSGQGGGGGGAGASLVIHTSGQVEVSTTLLDETIAPGTSGYFELSGIAPDYDYLEFELQSARAHETNGPYVARLFFNGDTTKENYFYATHQYGNVHIFGDDDGPNMGLVAEGDETPAYNSFITGKIYSYADTDYHTTVHSIGGCRNDTGSAQTRQYDFQWENTDVVNYLRLAIAGYDDHTFVPGTRCIIRGVKSQWVVTSGQYGSLNISNGLIVP